MNQYKNVKDDRTTDTSLKEIFTFTSEEKETHLTYDYEAKEWIVYSNVPEHMTKLLKLKSHNLQVVNVNETGAITSIAGKLEPKQVSFRNIIALTDEQKEKRSISAKERFSNTL